MGIKIWLIFLVVMCLSTGCSNSSPPDQQPPLSQGFTEPSWGFKEITPGSIYTGEIEVNTPEASGTIVYKGNGVTIDTSHTEDGYVMVKCEGIKEHVKIRVILGEQIYTYDLNTEGRYEVFPLQMGNGQYEVRVFKQVEGTTYSPVYDTQFEVNMPDTDRVFIFPNQYIWYTNEADAAKLSYDLCVGLSSDGEMAEEIYTYVTNFLSYDYEEAETVQSGYIPDLNEVMETKKGICFDYSALLAAMLRAQDIPVRLVIGYVQPENLYHAWNQVYIDGEWVWMDSTFGPDSTHKEKDYTEDRKY